MKITFLEAAQADLDEAIEYYNNERACLGNEFLIEILRALERITTFPQAGHMFSKRTRRSLIKRFPYGIIYQFFQDNILVIAITHLHRKPSYWKYRLKTL